ncbi:MAG: type II toxin-antitoxin system HicB family antitoxin [Clostridiales bacterium]|nr:type II toxin-antitoxin system HicB family antitoxin [Clostridiales bacterium]
MKSIYTAIFIQGEDGKTFYARVPDLPGCITTGDNLANAIEEITDAANLWLVTAEDHDDPIPAPTPQVDLVIENGAICSLISIDTIAYRAATDTRAVRKNVSLPAWMARLAEQRGINCSQVLQEGLLKKLV